MNPARTAQLSDCTVTGSVQALWNGPLLYLLFTVTDPDVDTASPMDARRSGVQVFVDQYNDKFPKFEEDDGSLIVSAAGQQSGNRPNANLLDLKKLVVTGFSRWGKAALVAGFLDDRFQVTAPGGSGSGGAAPYRYDSFGNRPFRSAPFGNVYPWGRSTGAETLGDHVRHQTHNSNEMIRRFLNDITPAAVEPRMYRTSTWGYGERLPFDHHEVVAAIAPRAVIIINTNDDYADNAEGDAIGYQGAKPVYAFLGAPQNLALDIDMGGGGHSLKPSQAANIVTFANMVFFGKPLSDDVKKRLTTDPYLDAGTYDTYYGGLKTMMPWDRFPPSELLLFVGHLDVAFAHR